MRTCAGILQIGGMILGILGIIGGFITLITPTSSYSTYSASSTSNFGLGVAAIASSVVAWIVLYAFGALLDAVADIREHVFRSAEADERTATAIEALVSRRQPKPEGASNEVPQETVVPTKATILQKMPKRN